MALLRPLVGSTALAIWAIGLGIVAVGAVLGGTTWALVQMRADQLQEAEFRLRDLSLLLGEQTRRTVQEIDQILRHAETDVQAHQGGELPRAREALHQSFRGHITRAPHLDALEFVAPNGDVLIHTSRFPAPIANYGAWEPLIVHRAGIVQGMHISLPVIPRGSDEGTIPFSRAVRDQRGNLQGVVSAAVQIGHLASLYTALNLGPGGGVRLYRQEGTMLVGSSALAANPGEDFGQTEVFKRAVESTGGTVLRHQDGPDDNRRLSAMLALGDPPLVVRVSMTERDILREWSRHAWAVGPLAFLTATLIGAISYLLARQLNEDAVLRNEAVAGRTRLGAIMDSAMDAIITINAEQHIVLYNDAAERIFGHPRTKVIGDTLDRLIPERFRATHMKHVERFGATGESTRRMGTKLVLFGLRANGEEFPIEASISQVSVGGRKFFTVILRDVTERVRSDAEIARSHEELRTLSKAANEALEAERTRVARELHDELGQQLTAMKIDVASLERALAVERPDLQTRCVHLRGLIDQTVASTRRIAADLRPLMLDDLGLGAALEWLTQNTSQRTGIGVRLAVDQALSEVPEPHASAIFRIVQESLTNVARHAKASMVEVEVRAADSHALVTVRDNGKGIATADQSKAGSFGLLGIKERARLIGGHASIENHPGGGTVIKARLPLAPVAMDEID